MTRERILVLALVVCLLSPALAAAQGCAMCGTVGKGGDDPLVRGLFASILFTVSMPFAIAAVVGSWLVHHLRRMGTGEAEAEEAGRVIPFQETKP